MTPEKTLAPSSAVSKCCAPKIPRKACKIWPSLSKSSAIPNAKLTGTANPKPSAPTSAVAIAVVIPIYSPLLFINAPPLDPLVIGASV